MARVPQTEGPAVDPLSEIREAVLQHNRSGVERLVEIAIDAGIEPETIINEALIEAMDRVGKRFAANEIFVPEMMVAALTMKAGLERVKPLLGGKKIGPKGRIMIATVKGDLHDIGKNIVAMMLEGAGFQVFDIGVNVDRDVIYSKIAALQPDILGLSALLTTTMPEMAAVIDGLSQAGLKERVRVIVGGAPLNERFARKIGADGYGADAAAAAALCKKLMLG